MVGGGGAVANDSSLFGFKILKNKTMINIINKLTTTANKILFNFIIFYYYKI